MSDSQTAEDHRSDSGDPGSVGVVSPGHHVIEVYVAELKNLFNSIDASPFREKDLDPKAEEFIVDWAKAFPKDAMPVLSVHIDRAIDLQTESAVLADAVHTYFGHRAGASRRRLRRLFQVGRTSLLIGFVVLVAFFLLSKVIADILGENAFGRTLQESFVIGGWVAMWRPMEIFLYDWWPIRSEARLFDRLSAMPVQVALTRNTGFAR